MNDLHSLDDTYLIRLMNRQKGENMYSLWSDSVYINIVGQMRRKARLNQQHPFCFHKLLTLFWSINSQHPKHASSLWLTSDASTESAVFESLRLCANEGTVSWPMGGYEDIDRGESFYGERKLMCYWRNSRSWTGAK